GQRCGRQYLVHRAARIAGVTDATSIGRCARFRFDAGLSGMRLNRMLSGGVIAAALLMVSGGGGRIDAQAPRPIPRPPDRRPDFEGIWQVQNRASYDLRDHSASDRIPGGLSVIEGGEIPYQPWAAAKKAENFANRATADPLARCYMPGLPRMMYMEWPLQ